MHTRPDTIWLKCHLFLASAQCAGTRMPKRGARRPSREPRRVQRRLDVALQLTQCGCPPIGPHRRECFVLPEPSENNKKQGKDSTSGTSAPDPSAAVKAARLAKVRGLLPKSEEEPSSSGAASSGAAAVPGSLDPKGEEYSPTEVAPTSPLPSEADFGD